ncbi:hypothetical protein Dsin_001247 [Dipteronia sinensis]|uniref:FAS1 domain-containing protein n=1 Tax=Dipteronia sinensis TaxID=43782 RepID=A0AAE0B409_9ROSI|nr:hypothetical protein Dsin_001247 [Dipteronia sinensis]
MAAVCDFIIIFFIVMSILISASAAATPTKNQDLVVAIEEMQRANYFTFVMLINMSPLSDQNVTFLMPNDKTLSRANLHQLSVSDFLLLHSIPSALLFENLDHIPSGSLIPSSIPDYMLRIYNGGRKNFLLNNVKIISPNICTLGSSIRCHGIDGMLNITQNNTSVSPPTCSGNKPSSSPDVVATPPMPPSISDHAPPLSDPNYQPPVAAPAPLPIPEKSSAGCLSCGEMSLKYLFVTLLMLSIMGMLV